MNKGKVELQNFTKSKDELAYRYSVEHNNGQTSVEQIMSIRSENGLLIAGNFCHDLK